MVVQLLEVFCCLLDVFFAGTAGASALPAFGESKTPVALANHQRSKKCGFDSCRTLTFRSTDYCWKHQGGEPHESDVPTPFRTTGESSWWEPKDE